jgi:hypothetical protein
MPTILAGGVLSVIVAFLAVDFLAAEFSGYEHEGMTLVPAALALTVGFVFLALTLTVVVGALAGAFGRGDERELLTTVGVSYFSLIVVFASVYFVESFLSDFSSAVITYREYRQQALAGANKPDLIDQRRAFGGIESRFWSGLDWPQIDGRFPGGLPAGSYAITPAEMRQTAASRKLAEVVRYLPESKLAIFGDCLHFSVITMTTVGYGDIWPRSPVARAGADIEAVCYTILLIFAVGMIFGNVRERLKKP